ncbi:hypothetical protein GMOD_00000439 [Pyrenophora seminiperda CCB06]|uniref:Uncharacterized protein n=1 Tax=Pyrenophora seminiperda CCB06 TaxID=1302712 RepID=A0A3M7M767_9PLEO|nr:hypothetical protein GMOD_00000439 [Pyrenophora seminiperda CCB06]
MPMAYSPDMLATSPRQKQPFASVQYGHRVQFASICGHNIHPSSAEHTPRCSSCAVSEASAKSDVALRLLSIHGGLHPPKNLRNQRWNQARKGYLIAKKRLDRARTDEQLRWEREQAWNHAHERVDFKRVQAAAVLPETFSQCLACDSMVAFYPTNIPEAPVAAYAAWWERPGALITTVPIVRRSRTSSLHHKQNPMHTQTTESNSRLRRIVQDHRKSKREKERLDQGWYSRNTAERAIREKFNIGQDFPIQEDFWDSPLRLMLCHQQREHTRTQKCVAERYERRNQLRPLPPPSPLSQSQLPEDLQVDADFAEKLYEKEEKSRRERQAKKVAKEVGYLYFVGGKGNDSALWNEDSEESNKSLVGRTALAEMPGSESSSSSEGTTDGGDVDENMRGIVDLNMRGIVDFDDMDLDDF